MLTLTEETSEPNIMTIILTDNDISLPFEWLCHLGLEIGFAQITLTDERIAIHKPTNTGTQYTKSCKVSDNSYIRSLGLLNVRVPKQFLKALDIRSGAKTDLMLEKNCISIRKHIDKPEHTESEFPEPSLAFCCVCGELHYTEQGLIRVSAKYICRDCIDIVKRLNV